MSKPEAPKKGPKPSTETAKKATDAAKLAGKQKIEQSKKPEKKETEKKLELLGAGVMYDIKKILFLWKKLWTEDLPGLGDKFENWMKRTDLSALRKETDAAEKRITVPKLNKQKQELQTKYAVMKKTDSLVKYLYASLGLEMPKLDQIKQKDKKGKDIPVKGLKLKHLIKQLKDANVGHLLGPKAILKEVKKRPPYFYKGDLVVLQSSTGKLTAGFIEAMSDDVVYIRNNKSAKPQKHYTNQLFLAFHFPGNKKKGNEIPKKLKEKKKSDKDKSRED